MITMASPASNPMPISTRWMPTSTWYPSPPAPIMDAITVMERASMMHWFTPAMIVGSATGSCTLKSFWRGVVPKASATSISSAGTCLIPRLVRRSAGGIAKITVAMMAGTLPRPKKITAGMR